MENMTKGLFHKFENQVYKHLFVGIPEFDNNGGFISEDFTVIAGNSGSGKSTIAYHMACTLAKYRHKVIFFNMENSHKTMVEKTKKLGFDYYKDFGEFDKNGEAERLKLIFPGENKITTENKINLSMIFNAITSHKPDAIFIDLFSCLLAGGHVNDIYSDTLHYAEILATYAKKFQCAIFVTEQLGKDGRRINRPSMEEIKGGSAIYQKATKVIMIYRYLRANFERQYRENKSVPHIVHIGTELQLVKDRSESINANLTLIKYEPYKGIQGVSENELDMYFDYVFNRK